jgi:hypothetical protein
MQIPGHTECASISAFEQQRIPDCSDVTRPRNEHPCQADFNRPLVGPRPRALRGLRRHPCLEVERRRAHRST